MVGVRIVRQQWLLSIVYGLTAAAAVGLTRFDGSVAFLWGSGAILIAALLRTPSGRWKEPLLACGLAGIPVTGFLGLGWAAAVPFAFINLFEAVVAAWLFRRLADPREPMQSLGWFFRFVLVVGIVAPLLAAILAAAGAGWLGKPPASALLHFFTGHSLGALTFTPLALLVTGRKARRDTWTALRRKRVEVTAVMTFVVSICVLVFSQHALPLLFLPVLAIILATFRIGREGAAIAIVLVALIGGVATVAGHGVTQLIAAGPGMRLLFLQFYLAATVLTVLPVSADLRNRQLIHRKLRVSEDRFRLLAEHCSDIMMHMAVDGTIRYVSPAVKRLGGHSPDALKGLNGLDFVAPQHVELVREAHRKVLGSAGQVIRFRYLGLTASGDQHWFETHSHALLDDDGAIEGVLSVSRDVSEQQAHEEVLAKAALTDSLTGLPNRRAFCGIVEARGAECHGSDCIALLDIDHFKRINDRHGHAVGDLVLREFAQIARSTLRQNDVVARIGGEEFAVLLPDTSRDQALKICERLREEIAFQPFSCNGRDVPVTVSGGVATLGEGGMDEALQRADEALYRAKGNGRDQLRLAA